MNVDQVQTDLLVSKIYYIFSSRKIREQFLKALFWHRNKNSIQNIQFEKWFFIKVSNSFALVVYRFKCRHDVDKVYIGKTKRHLATRVNEHSDSSSRSAIHDHASSYVVCQTGFSVECFQVSTH